MGAVGFALALAAVALGTVPTIGVAALIPASIGLVFSVVGLVQSRRTRSGKWISIPGVVLSVSAACWVPVAATVVPWLSRNIGGIAVAPAQRSVATATTTDRDFTARSRYSQGRFQNTHRPMPRQTPASDRPANVSSAAVGSEGRRDLDRQIAEFAKRASDGIENWPDEIRSLKNAIEEISDQGARDRLQERVIEAVSTLVDAEAAEALEAAQNVPAAEGLRVLDDFLRRIDSAEAAGFAVPVSRPVSVVLDLRRTLVLQEDPAQRYVPRGVVGGSHGVRVTLHDALTGENHLVAEGAVLPDGSTVSSISEDTREVLLTRSGEQYRVPW